MINREQVKKALDNPEEFQRLFKNSIDLRHVGVQFPDQVEALITYLFLHTDEFHRLIHENSDFTYIVEQLPKAADTIIRFVISHPEEFERLIKSQLDLNACAQSPAFDKYAGIFGKPTPALARDAVKEVNAVVKSNIAIFIAVRNLSIGKLDENSNVYALPPELIIKIASYMRDSSVHSEEYAKSVANKHYVNQKPEK